MINDLKQRAYEQERSENFGRAIELYESVIDHREAEGLTHQDASVFLRIADLHLRRDGEEDAIDAFQRAGELYAREGLQPQAIAVYRRILRIAPEHTEALWNLAWLHAEMGVMAEARDYVADYLQTVDMERDWVEAKDFLRRLLDLSEDLAIGLRLAELLEEAGRHDQALDVLERLDVDFGSTSALDEEEIRDRIESLRDEAVPEEERVDEEVSFEGAGGATSGFDDEPAGPGEDAVPAEDEDYDDEEYDLEVGAGDEDTLDEGFPFPDADDGMENGAFDDVEDEVERPPASFGDEVSAAGGEDVDGIDEFDDWDEQEEEDEEEPMSTHSQDLPGGPAVEGEDADEAAPEASSADRGGGGFGAPAPESAVGQQPGAAGRETDYEEEYGEKAELRRGLAVLDELIELDPDRLDHYRRRVGYAERLDDAQELVDSYGEMASALRRRGSSRGARLVYEHVLGLDVGAERAREGIEEVDRQAREALDVPDLLPEAGAPSDSEAERSELGRWVWPELERVRGQVQWLRGAAEMLRSDEEDGFGGGADDRPPAEAYELVGRYFLARGEVDDAIEVLSLALDREDLGDAELADVLFQLGLSHYRIDDRGSARKYFDRVASHDEDFGAVHGWVLAES